MKINYEMLMTGELLSDRSPDLLRNRAIAPVFRYLFFHFIINLYFTFLFNIFS